MYLCSFLKTTKLPLFLLHFLRCFVDKIDLPFKDEVVKHVIFCYTKEPNKLYDAKTSNGFCGLLKHNMLGCFNKVEKPNICLGPQKTAAIIGLKQC